MYINKLAVSSLCFVFLLVCSVILIGANHQPKIEWEYIKYEAKVDDYQIFHTVFLPGEELQLDWWVQDVASSKKGDWSLYGAYDALTVLGKETEGTKDDAGAKFPLFFYALNARLNLKQTDFENNRIDILMFNALGRAGYEWVYKESGRSEHNGQTFTHTFKRRIR